MIAHQFLCCKKEFKLPEDEGDEDLVYYKFVCTNCGELYWVLVSDQESQIWPNQMFLERFEVNEFTEEIVEGELND